MPQITIKRDPEGIIRSQTITLEGRQTLADLLPNIPGFDVTRTVVYLNGVRVNLPRYDGDTCIDRGDDELLSKRLESSDAVKIINEPAGLDPITVAYIAIAVSVAATVYTLMTMPNIEDPKVSKSSNNSFFGQSNSARPYEGIPDIYGTVRSYPDMMAAEPVSYSNGLNKIITHFLCIGIGQYTLNNARVGSTLLSQVNGVTMETFQPGALDVTTIPDYEEHFSCPNISGQDVIFEPDSLIVSYTYNGGSISNRVSYFADSDQLDFLMLIDDASPYASSPPIIGSTMTIGSGISVAGYPSILLAGDYLVTNSLYDSTAYFWADKTLHIISIANASTVVPALSGLPTGVYDITSPTPVTIETQSSIIGPFDIPFACQDIIIDTVYNGGLNGSADFKFTYQEIDGIGGATIGAPVEVNYTHSSGATSEDIERRMYSNLITINDVDGAEKFYRVKLQRTNAESDLSTEGSRAKVERIAGVRRYTSRDFDNITVVKIVSNQAKGAVNPRENLYNVEATRKTITYDMSTGTVVNTLNPSERFADAILHEWVKVFGRSYADLDLDGIYSIQSNIDKRAPELGKFCYSFDDKTTSIRSRLEIIANAVRCLVFNDNGMYRLTRNDANKQVSGNITKRDIARDRSYTRTFNLAMPNTNDSVRLEYIDPVSNKKAYIYKGFDASGNIIDKRGMNQKQLTLQGCRNYAQAENRAIYECTMLVQSMSSIKDTLTSIGGQYDIGDLLIYADPIRDDVCSGEILSVVDGVITLSEPFTLQSGVDYEIVFNGQFGEVFGPYEILGQTTEYDVEIDSVLAGDAFTSYLNERQIGSRFIISKIGVDESEKVVLVSKTPTGSGGVDVVMNSFSEKQFAFEADFYDAMTWSKVKSFAVSYGANVVKAGISSDGTTLCLVTDAREVIISTDNAETFTTVTALPNLTITALLVTNSYIIVGYEGGYAYKVDTSSFTSTELTRFLGSGMVAGDIGGAETGAIRSIVQASTSGRIFATVGNKWVGKSDNAGASWSGFGANLGLTSAVSGFTSIACSADGNTAVVVGVGGSFAKTFNGGTSWTEFADLSAGAGGYAVAMSASGMHTLISCGTGFVFVSSDFMVSFVNKGHYLGSDATMDARSVMVDQYGDRMAVAFDDGFFLYSSDSGNTWDQSPQYLNSGSTGSFVSVFADANIEKLYSISSTNILCKSLWI